HGGTWHYGQRGGAMRPFCALLTGRGHTVIDIDYRLVPQAHFPGQVMDVKRAVAWVRQNVDADRIILYGGSAGAHLALMAAYAPEHPDLHPPELSPDTELCVDGIIAAYPPTDMSLFLADCERRQPRTGAVNRLQARIADYVVRQQGIVPEGGGYVPLEGILPSFFGGTPDAIPDVYRFGSPVEHVTRNAPPTLLIHGDDDHLVPVEHSLRLYDVLCEHGVPVVLTRYPQSGHAFDFFLVPISPPARSMMYDVERFLARLAAI
ncbi:MAG: alpha/beta hydrolase fold domain-containing protein, partial [Anaerolineae bacterium]